MIEEFEYTGMWQLPDEHEERLCGAIRFTPGRKAVLDLIGYFKDAEADIITGILLDGRPCTLYKCSRMPMGVWDGRCQTSSYYVDMVIVGHHFQKPEQIKFKSVSVYYSHLDEWVGISGFDLRDFYNTRESVIKYKLPTPIQATIDDGYKVRIDFQVSANPPRSDPPYSTQESSIKQTTYIEIEASEETSFEEYMKVMRQIQHFLSLGVMTPVYPLTIKGIIETNEKEMFRWGNVPGNDNEKLKKFLKDERGIWWVENAEIRKLNDDRTIRISNGENSVEIIIDEKMEKATIELNDDIIHNLKVGKKNGELKIYKVSRPPVEIYHYALPNIPKIPKLFWFDVLFTFKDVFDRFDTFMRKWFEISDSLEPTVNLYFATLYVPDMYLNYHFMSLIQAIESFHRRMYGGKKVGYKGMWFRWDNVPGNDDENLIKILKDECDIGWVENAEICKSDDNRTICISNGIHSAELEIRTKWKATLKTGGNSISMKVKDIHLEERLKEIFNEYQHEIPDVFIQNKDTFITEMVENRHYWTHYEENPEKRAASGEDFFNLAKKLRILLEICLLRELGFSSDEIKNMFKRNRRYRTESIQYLFNSTSDTLETLNTSSTEVNT